MLMNYMTVHPLKRCILTLLIKRVKHHDFMSYRHRCRLQKMSGIFGLPTQIGYR
jgi:hypothetical protein